MTHIVMEGAKVKSHMRWDMRRKAKNVWRCQWWRKPNIYIFSNSLGPQNCCGLAPALLMACSDSGYGCPFGYKGKKGCGNVECETRPRLDVTHPQIVHKTQMQI
jgi:hypothetical protein